MSCGWREKIALYVDDELDPLALRDFSAHLGNCAECSAAVSAQMALKNAIRRAGTRFIAPPELRAAIYDAIHPARGVSPWWKWVFAPISAILLATLVLLQLPGKQPDPFMAQLVDQHVTNLASEHPVEVVSSDNHTVKPWYQGKLPFTFNLPVLADSSLKLAGGRVVYAGQQPGAQLLYEAGPHKISVFIFLTRHSDARAPSLNHDLSFNVERWTQGGLEYYLVTDANQEEAGKLASMFREANQ